MEKMTIHRALAELKLIDARIQKQTDELLPLGTAQEGKLVNGFHKKDDFEKNASSKYQSIKDLLKRKVSLKSAIVKSNAFTLVAIGEQTMTVADAISYKAIIVLKRNLVDTLKVRLKNTQSELNRNNETVNQNVQKLLEVTFGKEQIKVSQTDMEAVRNPYLKANEFHLVDPIGIEKEIEKLEAEIENFETEADAILSETNATTFIEI